MITNIECAEVRGELSYWCEWEGKGNYKINIKLSPETDELSSFSCDCKYGSFYGKSKNNKGKEICRHVLHAYAKTIKVSPARAREILIKQGLMSSHHLKRI